MGKPIVKLMQGARVLDLNDQSLYWLSQDFTPPGTQVEPLFTSVDGDTFDQIESNSAFSFTVAIKGNSAGQINGALRAIKAMLRQADRTTDALYLIYKASDSVPDPLYGQFDSLLRYEIAYGDATFSDGYMVGVRRETDVNVSISLILKPYRYGQPQRAFTATGGIVEDRFGMADGRSRGLIVAAATTNKMTNPVFGNATWSTGWTTGANIVSSDNTDSRWLLPGLDHSARLSNVSAFSELFTQSINAGNTNKHSLSCYAWREDGGVLSATQVQLYYNAALTTTFTAIGTGLYRLTAENIDGINAATDTGVIEKLRTVIYVAGFQFEEKAYSTPLCYGDLIGCAWTGTVHASTSTRTVATCKITAANDTFKQGAWSVRCVLKTPYAYTHPDSWFVFDARDGSNTGAPYLYFDSSGVFVAVYGGQSSTSAAQTHAKGATIVLHVVCSGSTITLYTNGVAAATSSAFNPVVFGAALFIGSSYSAAQHGNQTTMGWSTFDTALTAAQVSSDYTSVAAAIANENRLESIPYLWTIGGDGVLALTASHQPLGAVGGVPGTVGAISKIEGALSSNWSTIKSIALSNYACDLYLGIGPFLYDHSGTALAGDYGGEHLTTTVNGSAIALSPANPTLGAFIARQINGMEYYIFARLFGSAATAFSLYSNWSNSSINISSELQTVTPAAGTAYRMAITRLNKVAFDSYDTFQSGIKRGLGSAQVAHYIYASKIATNVDISVDYIAVMPSPCLLITGGSEAKTGFVVNGLSANHVSGTTLGYKLNTTGEVIEFEPDRINHLQCHFCPDGTVDPAITYTVTISAITVTPRWSLL